MDEATTLSRADLPPNDSASSVDKENKVSGLIGFSQEEYIEWDDNDHVDLRKVAQSPYGSLTPAMCASQAKQKSDVLRQLKRNIVESTTNQKSDVVTSATKTITPKVKKNSPSIHKASYSANKEVNGLFHRLQKEEDDIQGKPHEGEAAEAPTQRHQNSDQVQTGHPNVGEAEPQQLMATGLRRRKKRRDAVQLQNDKSKRPHHSKNASRIGRRPRSTGAKGIHGISQSLRSTLATSGGGKSTDFEVLLNQLDSDPNGRLSDIALDVSPALGKSEATAVAKVEVSKSNPYRRANSTERSPQAENSETLTTVLIPLNAPKHVQGPGWQRGDQSHSICSLPPPTPVESQRIYIPVDNSKHQRQKAQQLQPSTEQWKRSDLHHTAEEKTKVADEFGEMPDFSEADIASMDALVTAATKARVTVDSSNVCTAKNNEQEDVQQLPTCPSDSKFATGAKDGKNSASDSLGTDCIAKDGFGDFPMLDFEVLDKQIAERTASSHGQGALEPLPESVAGTSASGGKNAFNIVAPSAHGTARNQTTHSIDSGVAFVAFTRYKVVRVTDDTSTFTRTLAVVTWDPTMNCGDATSIHRSEITEQSASLMFPQADSDNPPSDDVHGCIFLRGEWYHTLVEAGDVVNLCSLSGEYRTDLDALPIALNSVPPQGSDLQDDLVLVVHPDTLVTPTVVSETVSCTRRAVIRSRLGSSGRMSRAALIGTMRHGLFERCMSSYDFTRKAAESFSRGIVKSNVEALVGCKIKDKDAESEVIEILPRLQQFAKKYTAFKDARYTEQQRTHKTISDEGASGSKLIGHVMQGDTNFVARSVKATEESAVSPELGLKGNVDMTVEGEFIIKNGLNVVHNALTGIELKTGHNQKPQNAHMAQLALYTLLLRMRYGSKKIPAETDTGSMGLLSPTRSADMGGSNGGVLLYLNHESYHAIHVSPTLTELKSLIGQRNAVASETKRALAPRGVVLCYANDGKDNSDDVATTSVIKKQRVRLVAAPPTVLPEIQTNPGTCSRCYLNRECMLYAKAELSAVPPNKLKSSLAKSHTQLLSEYTGHLKQDDITYFREWDRLIDLEADASAHSPAEAWLVGSAEREKVSGKCMSSLLFDDIGSAMINSTVPGSSQENLAGLLYSTAVVKLKRARSSALSTPLSSLKIERGSHVIVSTDATSIRLSPTQCSPSKPHVFRHRMYVLRGVLENVDETSVHIRSSAGELEQVKHLVLRYREQRKVDEKNHGTADEDDQLRFRIDKDEISTGTGTLRQNLINLFTSDSEKFLLKCDSDKTKSCHALHPLRLRMSWLRDTVVRFRPPSIRQSLAKSMFDALPEGIRNDLVDEFSGLNRDQQNAVKMVFCAQDYSLIQGMPGTGKTSTIAFVSRLLAIHGKRVLVSSYTHAAVDNLMLKLLEKGVVASQSKDPSIDIVRVGRKSSCHPAVHSIMVESVASARDRSVESLSATDQEPRLSGNVQEPPTAESLSFVISSAKIVGVSALTIPRSSLLMDQHFDVVIVDEAGQISQPAILGALMAADSFILVGDHKQLPPLVHSSVADEGGYGVSLFKRLADRFPESVAQLTLQYRMHGEICRLCNDLVYKGQLRCANDDVRYRRLMLPGFPSALPSLRHPAEPTMGWLARVIDPSRPVIFVNTDSIKEVSPKGHQTSGDVLRLATNQREDNMSSTFVGLESTFGKRAGGNIVNYTEAELVRYIIHGLTLCGLPESSIGVISPFRAQLRLFDQFPSFSDWKDSGLEASTIDRYQGRDKPVIILSLVRSNNRGKSGRLLDDSRRLNVAVSRAKRKLIVVGSFDTLLKGSAVLRPVLDGIKQRNMVETLPDAALDLYEI